MNHRKIITILTILSLIWIMPVVTGVIAFSDNGGQTSLINSSVDGVHFEVSVPHQYLELDTVTSGQTEYVRISLPTASKIAHPGAPELPFLTETIAVPFDAVLEIKVIPGKSQTRTVAADVIPAPTNTADWGEPEEGILLDHFPEVIQEIIPDIDIYTKDQNYPGILGDVSNIGVIRQQRIAGITLYPVQYNPVKQELTIYETLQVEVTFKGGTISSQRTTEADSPYFESLFNQTLLNYDGSQSLRMPVSQQMASERAGITPMAIPWTPPDPAWRVKVREDGFYQLTFSELQTAGLDVDNLDPQTFQLFNMGEQVAIHVETALIDEFNPGDSLLFYGQAVENKYTQDNVYWLTYGSGTGPYLRMPERDVTADGAAQAQFFTTTSEFEDNQWYWTGAPGGDDLERYFLDLITNFSDWTYSFTIDSPWDSWDGSGILDMALAGFTHFDAVSPDHHAEIYLNDMLIAEGYWDGQTWQTLIDEAIPPGTLVPGSNQMKVSLPLDTGATKDYVYIDWFNITYPRAFIAVNDELEFSYDITDAVQFKLEGFSSSSIALFDISDPTLVTQLINTDIQFEDPTYSLAFEENGGSGIKAYWTSETSTYDTVEAIEVDTPSDLQSELNTADHITITHAEFLTQAGDLAAFRSSQGLDAVVVDVQDIYDEFGYGIVGNTLIHDFLAYAYANWGSPAPSFIVLVGDGHYNPKGHNPGTYGTWRENYIPPYLSFADPMLGETAADNRYVTVVGDDTLPDMMLGRLAVNSPAEAAAFINKIIDYETQSIDGEWKKKVMAVADNPDFAGNFPASSQGLLACCLPSPYEPERVYLGLTHLNVASAKNGILDGINNGVFLVNFIGHAATRQWTGVDNVPAYSGAVFENSDIPSLTNEDQYPIMVAMTCREGYFINPHAVGHNSYEALAEGITKAEDKGAVASFSPTGVSVAQGHDTLNRALFNAIFGDLVSTLGQATTASKIGVWTSGNHLDLIDTYLLFGDPATNFQRVLMAFDDTYQTDYGTPLIVDESGGVLANDFDPNGLTLSAVLEENISNGTLQLNPNGSFEYSPDVNFFGADRFTYTADNGAQSSNIATVEIEVYPAYQFFIPLISK